MISFLQYDRQLTQIIGVLESDDFVLAIGLYYSLERRSGCAQLMVVVVTMGTPLVFTETPGNLLITTTTMC